MPRLVKVCVHCVKQEETTHSQVLPAALLSNVHSSAAVPSLSLVTTMAAAGGTMPHLYEPQRYPGGLLTFPARFLCAACSILGLVSTLGAAVTDQIAVVNGDGPLAAAAAASAHVTATQGAVNPLVESPRAVLDRYFPQFRNRCGNDKWKLDYQELHEEIVTGKTPPYYMTSVAVKKGLADRMVGLVTQFYVALLSRRAFTMVTHGDLPAFESICDMPYVNWTPPLNYSKKAIELVATPKAARSHMGAHQINLSLPSIDATQDSSVYRLYFTDKKPSEYQQLQQLTSSNLTLYPPGDHEVPFVLAAGNRGLSYRLMSNPYHKQQFWKYGLTPETAFMCGFFYLCSPNNAVISSKADLWESLNRPNILRIGIAVRVGDQVFQNPHSKKLSTSMQVGKELLATKAEPYFQCAMELEQEFALPDQEVVWYLISDSMPLRQAAKAKYGSKILTDTTTEVMHIARAGTTSSCSNDKSGAACSSRDSLDAAMQHGLGEMLSFSMVDYHVYYKYSGFGRLGAWLSAKHDNAYEINGSRPCRPAKPASSLIIHRTGAHV